MKFPIGIQQFQELRTEGWVYVDKTLHVYKMATEGKYYFLSRPRRVGKSILLSTLEAYFRGRKELFEGLAIERLETEWTEHAVLHFDLNAKPFKVLQDLYDLLNEQLTVYEQQYGSVPVDKSPEGRLRQLIRTAKKKTQRGVVVLVDEYDKPILQSIGDDALQADFRAALKAFYGTLKSADGDLRFAMLTGVTKFSKVSVFSDIFARILLGCIIHLVYCGLLATGGMVVIGLVQAHQLILWNCSRSRMWIQKSCRDMRQRQANRIAYRCGQATP